MGSTLSKNSNYSVKDNTGPPVEEGKIKPLVST